MNTAKRIVYALLPALSISCILLLLAILSAQPGSMVPAPGEVWDRFIRMMNVPISKATLPGHVWMSLNRVLIAFAASVVLGISLGIALGWSAAFHALVSPMFELLRPIPPIAWIPLAILWFGIGETSKIFIVFIGSFVPIVINTQSGMQSIDPLLINAGRVLGANYWQLLINVAFPATIPAILAGIKTALSGGWMCVLAAEMIAAKQGIGFLIVNGQELSDMALIVVCMLVIGVVSSLLSLCLTKLEGVFCPWQFKKSK